MNQTTKDQILRLIADAESAYQEALDEGHKDEMGYPYTAGYSRAALQCIRQLVELDV